MPLWRGCSRNTRAKGAPLAPPRCLLPPLRAKTAGLIIHFVPQSGTKLKLTENFDYQRGCLNLEFKSRV